MRAGAPRPAGRRLPVTPDAVHACPGADGARRPASRGRRPRLRGARRAARRLLLSRRGLGHRDRTRVARGGDRAGRDRDPPRGHRAARGRTVRAAVGDGRAHRGRRILEAACPGRLEAWWRVPYAARRLHRSRDLGGDRGGDAWCDRGARRRTRGSRADRQRAAADAGAVRHRAVARCTCVLVDAWPAAGW